MASDIIKVQFTFERDTKNTRRYQEVVAEGAPTMIGTLYVQKFVGQAFDGGKLPDALTVTIEEGSE